MGISLCVCAECMGFQRTTHMLRSRMPHTPHPSATSAPPPPPLAIRRIEPQESASRWRIVMEAVWRPSRSDDAASASMRAMDDAGAAVRRRRRPMSINIIPQRRRSVHEIDRPTKRTRGGGREAVECVSQ